MKINLKNRNNGEKMVKLYKDMSPAEKKAFDWEEKNLIEDNGYLYPYRKPAKLESIADNIEKRGYEAMRVSPTVTIKNGYKYRKVQGAQVGDGSARVPKVEWYDVGYIKESRAKGGTKVVGYSFKELAESYNWKGKEALLKSKLMFK
jgi:hypothetical protein